MTPTTLTTTAAAPGHVVPFAVAARLTAAAALLALALLHVLSPGLDPSWRMLSEYALGRAGPVLTLLFLCWAVSCWCAAISLAPLLDGVWAKFAVGLLVISGAGALMGAMFDLRHELHGAAFALGVPTLPFAALIVSVKLARRAGQGRAPLLVSAHATWIGLAVQAVTMAQFMSGLVRAGAFHPETRQVLAALPDGVPTGVGYANRFLVVACLAWLVVVGGAVRRLPPAR